MSLESREYRSLIHVEVFNWQKDCISILWIDFKESIFSFWMSDIFLRMVGISGNLDTFLSKPSLIPFGFLMLLLVVCCF